MKSLRAILVFILGALIVILTYKSKYQVFFLYSIIWGFSVLVGIILFAWTVTKDFINYQEKRQIREFLLSFICLAFVITILAMEYQIQSEFNKVTLVKAYYDGDTNGSGIDFKLDGTYIFDNSAVGIVEYQYGTYTLSNNIFTLDKSNIDNVIGTNSLLLTDKVGEYSKGKKEKYLIQIDSGGQVIDTMFEFRVTVDNR